MLPGCPSIFHGRETELQQVVESLRNEHARVAILGPGGMGKTSLALATLHHDDVANKYPTRYFVPCHSALTCADLTSVIATHLGLEQGPNLSKKIYRQLNHSPPSLLVLDNFETPWENSTTSRGEVEEFLSLVADVPQLAILITMRGGERPGKIKWSRPFLKPLQPLANSAAWQTFVDIADEAEHNAADIHQLLAVTDNLPLAVSLIANVAAYEGCPATLARWKEENTLLLSDGYDKRSSLDVSIMLSFSGPRMTPAAQDLLRILSLLPDGLSDADLVQSSLSIPNILACKATVIRTSLAYTDHDQRLKLLVPIREHIRNTLPPSALLKNPLWRYFCTVVDLWNHFEAFPSSDIVLRLAMNLGNIHALLADGLDSGMEGQDLILNIQSIMALNRFSLFTNRGPSSLITRLPEKLVLLRNKEIYGEYICMLFSTAGFTSIPDENQYISMGNQHFQHSNVIEKANWQNALGNYYFNQKEEIEKALECYEAALSLARDDGAPNQQSRRALHGIANAKTIMGNFQEGQVYAQKAAYQAECLSNLVYQSRALQIEVQCCAHLGDFQQASKLCAQARELLLVCGLQGSNADMSTLNYEAEIHLLKTEYAEAQNIHEFIAAGIQRGDLPTVSSALSLLNLAVIGVETGVCDADILHNIETTRRLIRTTLPFAGGLIFCDLAQAALHLRQGNVVVARQILSQSLRATTGNLEEAVTFCLERLANFEYGLDDIQTTLNWATLFLIFSLKTRNKLGCHNALKCLGDIFVAEADDTTGISLFEVALTGFDFMDVQRRRGECMVRIANIQERKGNLHKAVDLWAAAKPLFERSLQRKEMEQVDMKLALYHP
ncbi:hypothetical protein C8R43DRAFT_90464 [Mycena crocata]|nr:hypothetical protein C8R43DRAFT_90464 [Mycena crocata]